MIGPTGSVRVMVASEKLDVIPAQFLVLVVRRPKYACRSCEDGVIQAPAPARLIEGGLPTEVLIYTRNWDSNWFVENVALKLGLAGCPVLI